jgi:hypothetical protein
MPPYFSLVGAAAVVGAVVVVFAVEGGAVVTAGVDVAAGVVEVFVVEQPRANIEARTTNIKLKPIDFNNIPFCIVKTSSITLITHLD